MIDPTVAETTQPHLVAGVDEREHGRLEALPADRNAALRSAVCNGNVRDVERMVQDGASTTGLLRVAAMHGKLEVIRALIRLGAGKNLKAKRGAKALMVAASGGRVDVIAELVGRGANIDAKVKGAATALVAASYLGQVDAVEALICLGADVNISGPNGETALMLAASAGRVAVVTKLIELGASVDAKDENEATALMYTTGHVDVIAELVRLGAVVNAKNATGATALMMAALAGQVAVVDKLVELGASVDAKNIKGATALMHAASAGHVDVINTLLNRGANVHVTNEFDQSALVVAVEAGHIDAVNALLQHDARVGSVNDGATSTLMFAAHFGRVDMIAALLDRGANVNARDADDETALSYAASSGHVDAVVELILRGAGVDAKNNQGQAVLQRAATLGLLEVVVALIKHKADVNAKDQNGTTPLLAAAKQGHVAVVAELIRENANVNAADSSGKTALMLAAWSGHVEVAAELIHAGADVDAADNNGKTALMRAAEQSHVDVARELLARRARVDCVDTSGRTALLYAVREGRTKAVQLLLNNMALSHPVGCSVDAQLQRECESLLLLAGRAGYMPIFNALVKAGASVNVRSAHDGETPLISAARFDNFLAMSLLVAARGRGTSDGRDSDRLLCFEDVTGDECALLPGSLATMETLCAAVAAEFEPVCAHMMARLQRVCVALQHQQSQQQQQLACCSTSGEVADTPAFASTDTLVSFACILFRACRLLFEIEKKDSALQRIIASRAILRRVRDIGDELDRFTQLYGPVRKGSGTAALATDAAVPSSKDGIDDVTVDLQQQVQKRFEQALSTDDALAHGHDDFIKVSPGKFGILYRNNAKHDTALLLQYELQKCRQAPSEQTHAAFLEALLARFLRVCRIEAPPDVPAWFISPDDLEYHRWNSVRAEGAAVHDENDEGARSVRAKLFWFMMTKRYEGKWRGTNVTIEEVDNDNGNATSNLLTAASQWHARRHPNIVTLYCVCHIRGFVFVYDSPPGKLPLHEFLQARSESNSSLPWKLLLGAALGLQELHKCGVVHGSVRAETILVGPDLVAKLCGIGVPRRNVDDCGRAAINWQAPELVRRTSKQTFASDIYALGMCVLEALTLELPWTRVDYQTIDTAVRSGQLPDRPATMSDSEWDLIAEMCACDPTKRVDIAYVVERLKRFKLESEQASDESMLKSKNVDQHYFEELGHTIPSALKIVKERCDRLTDDEQWLSVNVLPALEFVFGLLQECKMTPADAEVKAFIDVLKQLQCFVRTAVSDKSMYRQKVSRKVALTHRVVFDKLDRLLDMLLVPDTHAIRAWRDEVASSIVNNSETSDADESSSSSITINYIDKSPEVYEQWTRDGLAEAAASQPSTWRPAWYLSLRELVFSEAGKIGQGAFGAVYKGRWNNAQVVIKFMGYENDFDTISTNLLLHEVRVWFGLRHPHVLELFGASHVDNRFFVCEWASGGDLLAFLKQPSNAHLAWQKLYEAALGLQYLHSVGVAHNDLKCDNIMVDADGRAKLIDFGLSALLNEAEIQITVKKIGAVNWRSPEYLVGGRPSCASDVYSFAMCIIEVVSGDVPWGKYTLPTAIKYQKKKGNTLPPLPASMTPKQRNLLELMTKYEATERVSMVLVVKMLEEIAQDPPTELDALEHDWTAVTIYSHGLPLLSAYFHAYYDPKTRSTSASAASLHQQSTRPLDRAIGLRFDLVVLLQLYSAASQQQLLTVEVTGENALKALRLRVGQTVLLDGLVAVDYNAPAIRNARDQSKRATSNQQTPPNLAESYAATMFAFESVDYTAASRRNTTSSPAIVALCSDWTDLFGSQSMLHANARLTLVSATPGLLTTRLVARLRHARRPVDPSRRRWCR